MCTPLFDILLTGQIAAGHDRHSVIDSLARLLDRDRRSVADLIRQGNQIIEHNVDAAAGRRCLEALARVGARGQMQPAAQGDAASPCAPVHSARPEASDRLFKVISPSPRPADVAYSPIQANRITGAPAAIDVNRIDTPPIALEAIALLAAYEDHAAGKTYLLVFCTNQKRPYQCDANRIIYADFPGTKATGVIASLRLFIRFVGRRHRGLYVDPSTAGFLEGRPPAILEIERGRLTTMIGAHLASLPARPVP